MLATREVEKMIQGLMYTCRRSFSALASGNGGHNQHRLFLKKLKSCCYERDAEDGFPGLRINVKSYASKAETAKHAVRISQLLNIPMESATSILLKRPSVAQLSEDRVICSLRGLKKLRFPDSVILQCPDVLGIHELTLQNIVAVYKETGIRYTKSPERLTKFHEYLSFSLQQLREEKIISAKFPVLENYFNVLGFSSEERKICLYTIHKGPETIPLSELRCQIQAHYISRILEVPLTKVDEKFRTSSHGKLVLQGLLSLRSVAEILLNEMNFSKKKLFVNLYLLSLSKERLLKNWEVIQADESKILATAMLQCPRILRNQSDSLQGILNILKANGFNQPLSSGASAVFTLSPSTVLKRIKLVEQDPDLVIHRNNDRFLELVFKFTAAKERLQAVETSSHCVNVPSLSNLVISGKRYEKSLESNLRGRGTDLVNYLKLHFPDKSFEDVREQLKYHPYWTHVPLKSCSQTLMYLLYFYGESKEELYYALPLVLYPKEKVEGLIEALVPSDTKEKQKAAVLSEPYFLQLILYYLEKPHHYTGNGVWPEDRPMPINRVTPSPVEENLPEYLPEEETFDDDEHDHDEELMETGY